MKLKSLLPALLTALVVTIFLCAGFLPAYKSLYKRLQLSKRDPLGLVQHPPVPFSDPTLPTVMFFGDSRAAQWPHRTLQTSWNYSNRGISEQSTEQIRLRYDTDIAPRHPDILILQLGINDLKSIPLFPDQKHLIAARCMENIEEIVHRASSDGISVILTTIFPLGKIPPARRLIWSNGVEDAIQDVNQHLETLTSSQVTILHTAPLLAERSGRIRSDFQRDYLHLNKEGYSALNAALIPLLDSAKIPD